MSNWPIAELDPLRRLRVLHAGLAGTVLMERELAVSFDRLWATLSDLEHSVPRFDRDVSRLVVDDRRPDPDRPGAERLRIRAWVAPWPTPVPQEVSLEPGFCWMVAPRRLYVVGMAAVPVNSDRVRLGHLEGVPRGGRPLAWASRRRHRRHVAHDVDGIERLFDGPPT